MGWLLGIKSQSFTTRFADQLAYRAVPVPARITSLSIGVPFEEIVKVSD
jgi:hypothetical protein